MPDWKSLVRARIGSLPVDPAREADIVDELALHVAQHVDELLRSGVPEHLAIDQALAPLSDPARIAREIARADRPRTAAPVPPAAEGAGVLVGLTRDLRYAFRVLRRAPAFAAAAIITLGLGIGANTTIFSVVHAVLLRPLPFQSADRLVMIGERGDNGRASNVGYATFVDWRQQSHSFDDMALVRSWSTTLAMNGEPERIAALRVSANYFGMLGVRPALGRDFRAADDTPATWRVVILSDRLWRRRFNADPGVIGRTLQMNDVQYEVIGVLPASFQPLISEHFYQRADIWAPVSAVRAGRMLSDSSSASGVAVIVDALE